MCATAFNTTLRKSLQSALHGDKNATEIAEKVRGSLKYFRSLEPTTRDIVRECYGKSTRMAIGVGIVMVAGSAFFSWFIREKRLER